MKKETEFAKFFRTATVKQKRKLFLRIAKEVVEEQRKIIGL